MIQSLASPIDLNPGIHTFAGATPMDQAVIDTTAPATHHINYVVTDSDGLTTTSTRTVIIEAAPSTSPVPATSTPSSPPPTIDASTTEATSTLPIAERWGSVWRNTPPRWMRFCT